MFYWPFFLLNWVRYAGFSFFPLPPWSRWVCRVWAILWVWVKDEVSPTGKRYITANQSRVTTLPTSLPLEVALSASLHVWRNNRVPVKRMELLCSIDLSSFWTESGMLASLFFLFLPGAGGSAGCGLSYGCELKMRFHPLVRDNCQFYSLQWRQRSTSSDERPEWTDISSPVHLSGCVPHTM